MSSGICEPCHLGVAFGLGVFLVFHLVQSTTVTTPLSER
jgi:hypothetical protein